MKQEELHKLIDDLDKQTTNQQASFGIFHYGGSVAESYIQADAEGLKRFALELLKAAQKMDNAADDKEIVHQDFNSSWINENSDTFIQYIQSASTAEATVPAPIISPATASKESFTEKLLPYGCFLALAIVIIAVIVGLWTLGKWIF